MPMADDFSIADSVLSEDKPLEPRGYAAEVFSDMERERQIGSSIAQSVNAKTDPARQAEALRIGREKNIPPDVAYRTLDALKAEPPKIDRNGLREVAPSYDKTLDRPDIGPITQSAIDEMPYFERVFRSFGQSFGSGMSDVEKMDITLKRMRGTASKQDLDRLAEIKKAQGDQVDYDIGKVAGFAQYAINSAPAMGTLIARTWDDVLTGATTGAATALIAGQLGPQIALPEEVATVPAAGLAGAVIGGTMGFAKENFEMLAPEVYDEAVDALDEDGQPLGHQTALAIANIAGGVNAAIDLFPASKFMKNVPLIDKLAGKIGQKVLVDAAVKNPLARKSLARIGRILETGVAEGGAELAQEASKLMSILAAGGVTDKQGNSIAAQVPSRLLEAGYGGLAGGTVTAGAGEAVTATASAASKIKPKNFIMSRAEAKRDSLVELGAAVANSKISKLSPEAMLDHARQMDEDGASQMSAPAEAVLKLFQLEGMTAAQIRQQYPEMMESLTEAGISKVEVPLSAQTVIKMAKLKGYAALADDIRPNPSEPTFNEAKQIETEMQASIDALDETEVADPQVPAEAPAAPPVQQQVAEQVKRQLIEGGRMAPDQAATNAEIFSAAITTMAERSKIQPKAFYDRYNISINRGDVADAKNGALLKQEEDDPFKSAAFKAAGAFRDNPAMTMGIDGEEWLQRKQKDAEDRYDRMRGVSGAPTAGLRSIDLPTEIVAQIKGLRNEKRVAGERQFDRLSEIVSEQGWQQQASPILISVNHRGEAFITEGNTRTAVGKAIGQPTIRAEIQWMNGAELVDGPWSPKAVAAMVAPKEEQALEQAPAPVIDPLTQAGEWRKTTVTATLDDGTEVEVPAGKAVDMLARRRTAIDQMLRCMNAS